MYFPSQPATSMRLIGFEDNFFAGPAEAERLEMERGRQAEFEKKTE